MATISARFSVVELRDLNKLRGSRSWHDFILDLALPHKSYMTYDETAELVEQKIRELTDR